MARVIGRCTSLGVTNIKFEVFAQYYESDLQILLGYGAGEAGASHAWEDLSAHGGNENLALVVAALYIRDLVVEAPAPRHGVSTTEWALLAYRFRPRTAQDRYDNGLTPNFVGDVNTQRAIYASAVHELCASDSCDHPWYHSVRELPAT